MKKVIIAGQELMPGESKEIDINIARLPSHTQIDTPIYAYRGYEDGPVLGLMAGMHGDEINGMEIVRKILELGLNKVKRGTVICLPIVNVYGFLNYSRDVPDGKDINRSFPGNKNGSLASRVAFHLMQDVVPFIDVGVDFHTGGGMRTNYPQVRCVMKDEQNVILASAFSAPFTIDSPYRPSSLRQAAAKLNKRIIVFEGGESMRFDNYAINTGISGTIRLMKHLNMVDHAPEPKEANRIIWHSSWVRAKQAGLFHTECLAGQVVEKGQEVGTITDPFGEFVERIKAPATGYIVGLNNNPVMNAGDALMHIGVDNMCKLSDDGDD
ncbi:MAG TPA: succinylglutamate desuccinylase/aspartoacylase family protein [Cyclobacteriaceae bacterium]|jgi:predicted deacylase|nr:succinylglutamate desuccinylase/aspartoacylase family protein [Cyclobacteriaceae bacterium]